MKRLIILMKRISNMQTIKIFAALYYPGNKVPQRGDIFKNPQLANTLTRLLFTAAMHFIKAILQKQ